MTHLLDTDTCVYWLRGHPAVRDRVIRANPDALSVSILTLAELRYGAACSQRPAENNRAIDGFLAGVTVHGVSPRVTDLFAQWKAALRTQGALIEDMDLLIAATAQSLDLVLVTGNARHFERLPGLRTESWA